MFPDGVTALISHLLSTTFCKILRSVDIHKWFQMWLRKNPSSLCFHSYYLKHLIKSSFSNPADFKAMKEGVRKCLFTPMFQDSFLQRSVTSKSSVGRQRIMSQTSEFLIYSSFDTHNDTFHLKEGNMKVLLYLWKTLEILPCCIEASAACPRRCSET